MKNSGWRSKKQWIRWALILPLILLIYFPAGLVADDAVKNPFSSNLFDISGPNSVGAKIIRVEVPSIVDRESRPVALQLWYPAAQNHAPATPYFHDNGILDILISDGYYFQSKETLESWRKITIPATTGAPSAEDTAKIPVILLSPGLGVLRHNYTRLAVELASWGYVVVSVDHLYNAPLRTAAGNIISPDDDPDAETPDFDQITVERAHDLQGIVALLKDGEHPELAGLSQLIDFDKIGALGHSMGGVVAFEACATQLVVDACVNMDGAPQATFPKTGIGKPALFLASDPRYSDKELLDKGRDPAAWRAGGERFRRDWQAIFELSPGVESNLLSVRGTGHLSFSDAPQVMPDTITRFGGDLSDFELVSKSILTTIRIFFDAHLKKQGDFNPQDIEKETGIIC